MKPLEIESLSFSIINKEAGKHNFSVEEWNIVQRMIHTSADFEYMKTIRFHPKAIANGIKAIQSGKAVITDTEMVKSGIRKNETSYFKVPVSCLIRKEEVKQYAQQNGTTRAHAAVDLAVPLMENGIYVVGNAPTALLRLIELVKAKKAKPALIIGLPVGFVNAAESKEELIDLNYPHISNTGRKGGSNIAASVINALLIMASKIL